MARKGIAGLRPGRKSRTATAVATLALAGAFTAAAPAFGGVEGGAAAPTVPTIRDAVCITNCVELRGATPGSVVQVSGANLASVTRMFFRSRSGHVVATVSRPTSTTATARVPKGAATGRVIVSDAYGNRSRPSAANIEIHRASELGTAGKLELTAAETTPARAFYFGVRAPRLNYIIGSSQKRNDLRIDVVDSRGQIARSFFRDDVPANSTQSVRWDGKTSSGRTAANGAYSFRVGSQSGRRAAPRSRRGGSGLTFRLFGYAFPVRGPHSYGDGIGAPRAGHTHQGQDVLARCGLPLVAARGGRVQYNSYQGAAGNYLVIDGLGTGRDFAYMHLAKRSPLRVGAVVHTGQVVGYVGRTGDATTCHLHFELWSPPGWYEGGHFLNPTPSLKAWDRYS